MLLVLSANDVVVIFWVFIGEVQPPSPLFDTAVMTTDAHATVKAKGNSVAVTSSVTTPHCYAIPTQKQIADSSMIYVSKAMGDILLIQPYSLPALPLR